MLNMLVDCRSAGSTSGASISTERGVVKPSNMLSAAASSGS